MQHGLFDRLQSSMGCLTGYNAAWVVCQVTVQHGLFDRLQCSLGFLTGYNAA